MDPTPVGVQHDRKLGSSTAARGGTLLDVEGWVHLSGYRASLLGIGYREVGEKNEGSYWEHCQRKDEPKKMRNFGLILRHLLYEFAAGVLNPLRAVHASLPLGQLLPYSISDIVTEEIPFSLRPCAKISVQIISKLNGVFPVEPYSRSGAKPL